MEGDAPASLQAISADNIDLLSQPISVTRISQGDLPLWRKTDIRLTQNDATLHMNIGLPIDHPYFQAMAEGNLSATEFISNVSGETPFRYSAIITPTLRTEPAEDRTGIGMVIIDAKLPYPLTEYGLGSGVSSRSDWYGPPVGIGAWPLLTDQDSVQLRFADVQPLRFRGLLPIQLSSVSALWRGPAIGGWRVQLFQVELNVPGISQQGTTVPKSQDKSDKQREEDIRQKEREQQKREFLREIEQRNPRNLATLTWRVLVILIPYFGLLWLARRGGPGDQPSWKPLIGAVIVLAVWRNWWYFADLLSAGPGIWLQKLANQISYVFFWKSNLDLGNLLIAAPQNAFWLLFVLFASLAPYYLVTVEQNTSWRPQYPRPRLSHFRRAILNLRLLVGALGLVLLIAGTFLHGWVNSNPNIGFFLTYQLDHSQFSQQTIEIIRSGLFDPVVLTVIQMCLVFTILLALDWRTALFSAGLSGVVLFHWLNPLKNLGDLLQTRGVFPEVFWGYEALTSLWTQHAAWWLVKILAGLSAFPLTAKLLFSLLPSETPGGWLKRRGFLALDFLLLAFFLPSLPPFWLLLIGGGLLLVSFARVTSRGLSEMGIVKELKDATIANNTLGEIFQRYRWIVYLTLLLIGLALVWPITSSTNPLDFRDMSGFSGELTGFFGYFLALALILTLRDEALTNERPLLSYPVLEIGVVLFSVFVVNSTATWLFIPVPFLVSLIVAGYWLFKHREEVWQREGALIAAAADRKKLIQDVTDLAPAQVSFSAVQKNLNKKLEESELLPYQYKRKLAVYKRHFEEQLTLEKRAGFLSKNIVFAIGEQGVWDNTLLMVRLGALLAIIPVLVALYEYMLSTGVNYPYPVADLMVFLVSATASWLLYAFFFGYYYVHLRGDNGLTKGLYLFAGLVIPFAAYRFVNAQTLEEMRPFFFWIAQIFLFCTILGLAGVEYRLLHNNGYRLRDVLTVHNIPFISVYASSVLAAVAPTILAIITGRLNELVKFFLETVLPRSTGGG